MGRLARCLALACVMAFTSAGAAHAQVERGEIRLTVTDQTGLPLVAAGTLTSEAPQLLRSFATDANGRFALQDLPFGVFRLIVERSGFLPASTVVEVRTAVPRTLTIQLSLAGCLVRRHRDERDAARRHSARRRDVFDRCAADPGCIAGGAGAPDPRTRRLAAWLVDGGQRCPASTRFRVPDAVRHRRRADGRESLACVRARSAGRRCAGNGGAHWKFSRRVRAEARRRRRGDDRSTTSSGAFTDWSTSRAAALPPRRQARWAGTDGAEGHWPSARRPRATDRYLDPPTEDNFTNHGSLSGLTAAYDEQLSETNRLRFTWHHRANDFLVPNERFKRRPASVRSAPATRILPRAPGPGSWAPAMS